MSNERDRERAESISFLPIPLMDMLARTFQKCGLRQAIASSMMLAATAP
jgi:hypothetical protein